MNQNHANDRLRDKVKTWTDGVVSIVQTTGETIVSVTGAVMDTGLGIFLKVVKLPSEAFLLRPYGRNLLEPNADTFFTVAGWVLVMVYFHQVNAFYALMDGMFGGWYAVPLSLALSAALGTLPLAFDRNFIVADNGAAYREKGIFSRQRLSFAARLATVLAFASATGPLVAVNSNRADIELEMQKREHAAQTTVREEAIIKVKAEYAERTGARTGAAKDDLDADRQNWKEKRTDLLSKHEKEIEAKETSLKDLKNRERDQIGGTNGATAGRGPRYRKFKEEIEEAQRDLDETRRRHSQELADFNRQEKEALGDSSDKRKTETLAAIIERDNKIQEIRTAPIDQVTATYGGNWHIARTSFSMMVVLISLMLNSWIMLILVLLRVLVNIAFELIPVLMKLLAPESVKNYTSLPHQAASGQPEAARQIMQMGYSDPAKLAVSPEAEAAQTKFLELCVQATAELTKLHNYLHLLADEKTNDAGLHLTYHELVAKAHLFWISKNRSSKSPQEVMVELAKHVEDANNKGITLPPWPSLVNNGQVLLRAQDPWKITETELVENYAWKNPGAIITDANQAAVFYLDQQRELFERVQRARKDLRDQFRRFPVLGFNVAANELLVIWESSIQPFLFDIARTERTIVSGGLAIPTWPDHYPDPRGNLEQFFVRPTEKDFEALGWRGSIMLRTSPDAAVSLPTPSHLVQGDFFTLNAMDSDPITARLPTSPTIPATFHRQTRSRRRAHPRGAWCVDYA